MNSSAKDYTIGDLNLRVLERLPGYDIPVYHTHGIRQGMGTCKLHSNPECSVLKNWQPGKIMGSQLAKIVINDWRKEVPETHVRCKRCWSEERETKRANLLEAKRECEEAAKVIMAEFESHPNGATIHGYGIRKAAISELIGMARSDIRFGKYEEAAGNIARAWENIEALKRIRDNGWSAWPPRRV